MDLKLIGKWTFIVGLVLCLFTGLFAVPFIALVLFVLGLAVGFMNITTKETQKFLVASIALMVMGVASIQALAILGTVISGAIETILASFIAFVGAAALVLAVKAIVEINK